MKQKILQTLVSLNTLEDVDYLIAKIQVTDKVNRRTIKGRKLTEELLNACNKRAREIIQEQGLVPFN